MKKALKKQIKQDELVSGYERVQAWLRSHSEEARATLVGLVVLAAAGGGLYYLRSHRGHEARVSFEEAWEIYRAPVVKPSDNQQMTAGLTFTTAAEKYQRALTAFEGVATRYASLPEGSRARYYAAVCKLQLGDVDGAASLLKVVAAHKGRDEIEPAQAALALADVSRRKGLYDQAVDAYRRLLDDKDSPLPRDEVLKNLAGALDDAHKTPQAIAAYRQLIDEFPSSAYAAEARQRIEYLKPTIQGNS